MNRALAGTLVAAAALHVGLLVAASRLPALVLASAPHEGEVSVELLEPSPRLAPAPQAKQPDVSAPSGRQKVASYVPPRGAAHAAPLTGAESSTALPAAPAPGELPSPGSAKPAPAPRRPVNLGLGGDIYWMMKDQHVRRPERSRPRRSGPRTAGGLAEGLEARDRAKGLGRGGPVANAAREVANRVGPQQGHATFVVETDPHGRVRSVQLVGVSADLELWNKVARGLRAALERRAALRVPPGAHGLRVGVLVEARVQLPSGASPGGSVHFKGAGLGFDVADIGATPKRVVYARITSEVVL